MAVIVGIDTDSRGAIALLDTDQWSLDVYPLPTLKTELKSEKTRLSLDYPVLVAIMIDLIWPADAVWLEEQWGRPGQSAQSTYGFGQTNGDIRASVAAALYLNLRDLEAVRKRIHLASGAKWKGALSLSSDKAHTRNVATAFFPDCAHAWKLVSKHTSAAEAALLACYGAAQMGIKLPSPGTIKPAKGPPRTTHAPRLT